MLCGSVKYATKITSQQTRKSKMYIYESEEKRGGKIDRERERVHDSGEIKRE